MQMSPHIHVALADSRAHEIRRTVTQIRQQIPEPEARKARSSGGIRRSVAALGTLRQA